MESRSWKRPFLFAFLGGILLIVILFFARPLYLPDAFIIRQLEKRLSAAAGVQLDIESGRVRFLKGATLKGVTLQDSLGQEIATLGELHLRYRPFRLLQRRLVIENLIFTDLIMHFAPGSRPKPEAAMEAPLISPLVEEAKNTYPLSTDEPDKLPFQFDLPLPVTVRHLEISSAGIHLTLRRPHALLEAHFGGLNLEGRELFFKDSNDFHALISFRQDDSLTVFLRLDDLEIKAKSVMKSFAELRVRQDRSSADFSVTLQPELEAGSDPAMLCTFSLPEIGMSCEAALDENRDLQLNEINLSLDGEPALKASATLTDIMRMRELKVQVQEGQLDLELLWKILGEASSLLDVEPLIRGRALSGRFNLLQSNLNGTFLGPEPHFQAGFRWALEDVVFNDYNADFSLSRLDASASTDGRLFLTGGFSINVETDVQAQYLELLDPAGRAITISPLTVGIAGGIEPGWKTPRLQITWQGAGPLTGEQKGSFALHADELNLRDPLSSPGLFLESGGSVKDLPLSVLIPEKYSGTLSAAFDLKMENFSDIEVQIGVLCPDLEINLPEKVFPLPDLTMRLAGKGALSPRLDWVEADEVILDVSPYLEVSLSGELSADRQWAVRDARLNLDIGEVLPVIEPLLPSQLRDVTAMGRAALIGTARGQLGRSGINFKQNMRIEAEGLSLALPQLGLELDSTFLQATISGDMRAVDLSGELSVGRLASEALRTEPYHDLTAGWEGRYNSLNDLASGSLWVESAELGLRAEAGGQFAASNGYPLVSCEVRFNFDSADSSQLFEGLTLTGNSQGHLDLLLSPDSTLRIEGALEAQDLSLRYLDIFAAGGLKLNFPLDVTLKSSPDQLTVYNMQDQPLALGDPVLFATSEHLFRPERDNGEVHCRHLRFAGYEVSDLDGFLSFRQGRLDAPRFTFNAYGGMLQGTGSIEFPALHPDSVNYRIGISAEGIDTARLPGARAREGEEGEVSAFARFEGQGLNPDGYFNLNGGLDITRIGRHVADNLLRLLDPDQTDPSIQTYRRYIKRGWSVKVFSFDVKDDFVYVSITPARPPITKPDMFILSHLVGLGKSVTFGRLPLKFFLAPQIPSE